MASKLSRNKSFNYSYNSSVSFLLLNETSNEHVSEAEEKKKLKEPQCVKVSQIYLSPFIIKTIDHLNANFLNVH